jgi:NADH:ubiquinone oxidoreductase subunit D
LLTDADSDYLPVIEQKLHAAGFPDDKTALDVLDSVERSRYVKYLIANTHRIRSHLYQVSIGVCDDVMAPPRGMWEPRLRAFGLDDVAEDMERLYDEVGFTEIYRPNG